MNARQMITLLLIGAFVIPGSVLPVIANSSYNVSIQGSIDTPDQTRTVGGQEYRISAIARTAPGDSISADVTAPAKSTYQVLLYNSDDPPKVVNQKEGTGSQTITFDMTDTDSGSYMLAVSKSRDIKAIFPVVVRGYQVSISHKTTKEVLTVNASLTNKENVESPTKVTVVALKDGTTLQEEAEKQHAETYEAKISLADAPSGTYRVYAVVQGSNTVFGETRQEILGISDATKVDINSQTSTTESSEPPSQTSTTPITTATQTTTTTQSTAPTATQSTQITTTVSDKTSTSTIETPRTTRLPTQTSTTESIITPDSTTEAPASTQNGSASGPTVNGFNWGVAIVALLSATYLYARRVS